jgi:hypothetical protein
MNDKIMGIFKDLQNLKNVDLTPEQKNHVYSTEGEFHTDFQGDLILSFNNKNAWYYNKDIQLELNVTNNRLVDVCKITDNSLSQITRIDNNENKFIIKDIKSSVDLKIRLEKNDTVGWSFKVLDNNSIDFNMSFSYDNLGVLNDVFLELNELNNYKTSHELYISDLHRKIENQYIIIGDNEHIIKELNTIINDKDKAIVNQDIIIGDNEYIIKELNTIINDKDKAIVNKDILIKKKDINIVNLENTINNLNTKLNNYVTHNTKVEIPNYSFTQPIEYSSKYNNSEINSWNSFFNTNSNQEQENKNKSKKNKHNFW